jgi:hypothetical protein
MNKGEKKVEEATDIMICDEADPTFTCLIENKLIPKMIQLTLPLYF